MTDDTGRPLLPPRNNVSQTAHHEVVFHNDYSTPSDSIVADTNVYTETYDNPLRRKSVHQGKDSTTLEVLQETGATKPPKKTDKVCNKYSNSGSKDCEGVNVLAANLPYQSSTDDMNPETVKMKESGARRGNEYKVANITDTNDESGELSKPYFTLAKTFDSVNEEIANDNCHSSTPEKRDNSISTATDNIDYEDTSIFDGRFSQNMHNKSGTDTQEKEDNNAGEKSLLCTISPVLLKQLNIKIVPDDNEYAIRYKNWPRSSSFEKTLNSESDLNDIIQWKCNNERQQEAVLHDNRNVENDEYDKLSYVRRVVSSEKERSVYNHVVITQEETQAKSRSRRASV